MHEASENKELHQRRLFLFLHFLDSLHFLWTSGSLHIHIWYEHWCVCVFVYKRETKINHILYSSIKGYTHSCTDCRIFYFLFWDCCCCFCLLRYFFSLFSFSLFFLRVFQVCISFKNICHLNHMANKPQNIYKNDESQWIWCGLIV